MQSTEASSATNYADRQRVSPLLIRMHPNVRRGLPLFCDRRRAPALMLGFQRVYLNLRLTTMTHVWGDWCPCHGVSAASVSGVCKMRSRQQSIAILADNAANLVIQLHELKQLRERLRKAEQSARRSRPRTRQRRART